MSNKNTSIINKVCSKARQKDVEKQNNLFFKIKKWRDDQVFTNYFISLVLVLQLFHHNMKVILQHNACLQLNRSKNLSTYRTFEIRFEQQWRHCLWYWIASKGKWVFFTVVPCILILSKSFIYQLMHNKVALKEY